MIKKGMTVGGYSGERVGCMAANYYGEKKRRGSDEKQEGGGELSMDSGRGEFQ